MNSAQPYSLAAPQGEPKSPTGNYELGGVEAARLKAQVEQGDLSGLRTYLSRTRSERDWQDRIYMLELIAPSIRMPDLDFACEVEPNSPDLFVIRCAFFSELALKMRGKGTADKVAEGRFHDAAACVRASIDALQKASSLDPEDPTAPAYVLRPLTIFGELFPLLNASFQKTVELAPGLVPAHRALVNALSERWYGSHEKSLQFARTALSKAEQGSDIAVCLFWAHTLVRTHLRGFDKKPEAAARYLRDVDVTSELNAAFDAWTSANYVARQSSIPYLHTAAYWYYLARDRERLGRALSLTNGVFVSSAWTSGGDPKIIYADALLFAGLISPQSREGDKSDLCLTLLGNGADAIAGGKLADAEKYLTVALELTRALAREQESHLIPLAMLNMSLLRQKQKRAEDSGKLREEAKALLDASDSSVPSAKFQQLMAQTLFALGEFRRSIPFWEQAIQLTEEDSDPVRMATMLHKLGDCYSRMGLKDHAIVPLRAALKIFGTFPDDPRLPSVLLTLGNALKARHSFEAEACYKQSADWRIARKQYDSATPTWVNLGVLCAEQGRYDEALEHYHRALKLREQAPVKSASGIAGVLNNIGNCYRQMGQFKSAHAHVDRAIKLYSTEDAGLASAYNTRGLIFMDSGDDKRAAEWLRKGFEVRMSQPSPNLESAAKDLETEIIVLTRLGRVDDLARVEGKLASIRGELQAIPQVDVDLGVTRPQKEGAVFVELVFGASPANTEWRSSMNILAHKFSERVRTEDAGYYSGWAAVPENTTLIFYGRDAEVLFKTIEPDLAGEAACSGAKVMIWQGSACREVVLAGKVKRLN